MQELLNPSDSPMIAPTANNRHTRPNLVQVEERSLDSFHAEITDKTSKLSVEQLEQVNSVLMDELWRTRGEWDRGKVLEDLTKAFNWVLDDMAEAGQEMASSGSWGKKTQ